jgi:hypothetical protein
MAGDPFKKVMPGDRLAMPAEVFNTLQDLLRKAKAERFNQADGGPPQKLPNGMVYVRNDSCSSLDQFSVLGVDGSIFDTCCGEELITFKGCPALKGVKIPPDGCSALKYEGRFVVIAEPLDCCQVGKAWAMGYFPVQIQVDDEHHRFADIDPDHPERLRSCGDGAAFIEWKESGTGLKWAVVKLGIPPDDWWWAKINCWSNDEPKRHDWVEVVPDGNGNWVSKEGGMYGDSGCCCGAYDAYGREKMPSGTLVKMRQEMMCNGCRRYIFDGGPGCSKYLLDGSCNYGVRFDATGRVTEAQVLDNCQPPHLHWVKLADLQGV